MAKGAKASKSGNLVPLVVLLVVLCVLLLVGYVVYSVVQDVAQQTNKKMEKKNITFSRDGMKVGVKEITSEQYEDTTQNMLVKVWNNASFKGRFASWGGPPSAGSTTSTQTATPGVGFEKRKSFSRSVSSQQKTK